MIANRYMPTGNTAAGGMGDVLQCTDSHLQRAVIIKKLQTGIEERRLIDEQKALAKLRSKHVVQLYDIIVLTEGEMRNNAIVIEFIAGKDLVAGSFLVNRDYLNVLWQIASGLRDIHEAGVIHRDIKPNNIRLDTEGVIKIIDFGLARSSDAAKTQSIIGTPLFMAPELWNNGTVSFDMLIDVYAFGVTCLVLLGTDIPNELTTIPPQAVSLTDLTALLVGLPADLVALIHACLSINPLKRPQMIDVQSLLARHLLKDQHRSLVVMTGQVHVLDKANRKIHLNAGTVGSLAIEYDGFDFNVSSASGSVYFNNSPAQVGGIVPGCCVITFGDGASRRFVTFDVSHPEVMS